MPLFGRREEKAKANCIKCGAKILSDADYCTACGASQKPTQSTPTEFESEHVLGRKWRDYLNLNNGEIIVEDCNLEFSEGMEFDIGTMKYGVILTNQRLVILEKIFTGEDRELTSFKFKEEFPLESIKDLYEEHYALIVDAVKGKYSFEEGRIMECRGMPHKIEVGRDAFRYFRDKVIEQKERKATVTLDFSSLKSVMEKGGIVVTTLACPKCNAPMKIPTDGTETVCEHCGSRVIAQDIFKKLKTLLS